MDHNAHPDYRYELEDATHSHDGINASCGDELTLYLKIDDANDIIEEASFTGHGCAISQASADMMAGLIEGESIDEAKRLLGLFIGMIQGNELSEDDIEDLDEAAELVADDDACCPPHPATHSAAQTTSTALSNNVSVLFIDLIGTSPSCQWRRLP